MNEQLLDLTKKVQTVLDLRKIPQLKAQVVLAIDGSYSMQGLYKNKTVQKTVDRISAVAVKFDDNQELDVMVFDNDIEEANSATVEMFGSYVEKELLGKGLVKWGGTNYACFIRKVVENYFSKNIMASAGSSILGALKSVFGSKPAVEDPSTSSKSKSGFPVLCIAITDGDNQNKAETTALLEQMQNKDVYWMFIGIGNANFSYIKNVADTLPNVGFYPLEDLENVKDMELYKEIINPELVEFFKKYTNN